MTRSCCCCETITWKGKHKCSTFFYFYYLFASASECIERDFLKKLKNLRQRHKRSLVTDENRPKMKSSVQIVCAMGEWNFKFKFRDVL
mgnify:CR=1 FL=1